MNYNTPVLHIIADLGNGGAERQLIELVKKNPTHKILILKNAGIYEQELKKLKILYSELNIKNYLGLIVNFFKIRKIIKITNARVIHTWMYNACLIVSCISLFTKIHSYVVWGVRCSNMEVKHYSFFLKLVIKLCKVFSYKPDAIVYNSHAGLHYHKKIGFSAKTSKVIYNGIDHKKFFNSNFKRKMVRKKLGINKDMIVIIFAARVDPMKNHSNLLKAYEKVRNKYKNICLLLLGKGTEGLKKQEGVISLGMKIDIENYYSVGDYIILPSIFGEGFSNVLAEGMLSNLIPITTDVGDSLNIVENKGIIIEDGSVNAIIEALQKSLEIKKKKINTMKKKARKKILNEFSIIKMSNHYNKFYKELA